MFTKVRLWLLFALFALFTVVQEAPAQATQPDPDNAYSFAALCGGNFWPSNGSVTTTTLPGDEFLVEVRFTLSTSELASLVCVDEYLEIEIALEGFDVPNWYSEYEIVASNLSGKGMLHDVDWNPPNQAYTASPAVTHILTEYLNANVEYYVTFHFDLQPTTNPQFVDVRWVPAHQSAYDRWGTVDWTYEANVEIPSCNYGNVVGNQAWCVFPTVTHFLSDNVFGNKLRFPGSVTAGSSSYIYRWSTGYSSQPVPSQSDDPAPPAPPAILQSATHQTMLDSTGRLWFLSVKESGTLYSQYYQAGSGWSSFTQHGDANSWSTTGSPAIVEDNAGRVWLAAVKDNGTLWAQHLDTGGNWSSFTKLGSTNAWAPGAGVALVARPNGDVTAAGVSQTGLLWHTTGNTSGWTGPVAHGVGQPWSVTATPGLAVDTGGNLWLGGVKQNGYAYTRYHNGTSWSSFTQHGNPGHWAPDVGMVMEPRTDGNMSFAVVSSGGTLYHRTGNTSSWVGFYQHGVSNSWSTTASPDLLAFGNEFWISAVKQNGTLYTRAYANGGWNPFVKHGVNNQWSSDSGVTLTDRSNGQVSMFSVTESGTLYHVTGDDTGSWTGLYQHGVSNSWAN